jgi:hypothetical protein
MCQAPRSAGTRTTHTGVHVWASDPWHPAALASIANLYMVCDNDMATAGLQGGGTCASEGGVVVDPGGGH